MIITSKAIKKQLRNIWDIRDIWMTDRNFYLVDKARRLELIEESSVAKKIYIPGIRECEDFAISLLSNLRNAQADRFLCSCEGKRHVNWAFGKCMGTKFNGVKKKHTLNIGIFQDGIFLIEPQTNEMWRADRKKDDLYFIEF